MRISTRNGWSDKTIQLPNQSLFHEKIRIILCEDLYFKKITSYQEVPVKDICPEFNNNLCRFDWYLETINTILELHGKQHYNVVNWGNSSFEDSKKNFLSNRVRDINKYEAAIAAGINYVEISYKEYPKINAVRLKELIFT